MPEIKKREIDLQLSGQVQKAVFSLMFNYKKMRSGELVTKLGYGHSSVTNALKALIELDAVVFIKRGLYELNKDVVK